MKLHAAAPSAYNLITAYGAGYVAVNGQRHEASLVVLPEKTFPWGPQSFDALKGEDFEALRSLAVDIILLGTGPQQRFPDPRLTVQLREARVGLEVMDVQAACRTYNILVAEERRVAAALLFK